MTELYTTMGKRRLLKIFESAESQGIYLNRFPDLRNGRRENYHENFCEDDKFGFRINVDSANSEAINMLIYPISHEKMPGRVLAYDEDTRNNLQKQRLRYDAWFRRYQDAIPLVMDTDEVTPLEAAYKISMEFLKKYDR